ncbi:MAG: Rne/Rng family ribonuclease [Burkholderiales bacterium]
MKRMLFNATHSEELRVAIVDGQKLLDLDIETTGKEQRKSNIYKGVVTRIEPSLEAAFIDYGADRHGFLPFKEVSRAFFRNPEADPTRTRIQDALKEGQELIVQVDKDERGNKGAALTTFVSLAGRYLVLMPNNPRGGGVSRRVEGEERNELRDNIGQLDIPPGMSVIARTAGIGRTAEELSWDLNYLLQLWHAIENAAKQQQGAFLIYQEGSLVIRAIRDYFHQDIGEILIDTETIFEQARQFMGHVMPHNVSRVKLYSDDVPLFSRFQIEHQIETAYSRQVPLPSGGSVVIDHTEAMVAIDVNSARSTRGSDIEETALRTNVEAADEIARQLRLRDLGGLVVIDFIDMEIQKSQREVENRLRDALKFDRARVQTGKISRFGLLELSRQRLQTSLGETSHIPCPRCSGTGHIRSIESTALHILRILQEEAMKEGTASVAAQVPVDVATYLLNEKRTEFEQMEQRMKVNFVLIPNIHLETPNYTVTRLRHDELNQQTTPQPSYRMVEVPPEASESLPMQKPEVTRPQAAVQGITPTQPAPIREEPKALSIFEKIFGWLTRSVDESKEAVKTRPRDQQQRRPARDDRRRDRGERKEGRGRGRESREETRQDGRRDQRPPRPQNGDQRRQPQDRTQPPRVPNREQSQQAQAETAPAAIEQRLPGDRVEESTESRGGRRRRRRGRGERRPDTPARTQASPDAEQSQPASAVPPAPTMVPEPAIAALPEVDNRPFAMEEASPLPETETGTEQIQTAPIMTSLPDLPPSEEVAMAVAAVHEEPEQPGQTEEHPAPAPESRPQPEQALEVAHAPDEPPRKVEPTPVAAPSDWQMPPVELPTDLVLIETQPEKLAQARVQEVQEPEPPKPRRTRPPEPEIQDEPLVQIETRNEQPTERESV